MGSIGVVYYVNSVVFIRICILPSHLSLQNLNHAMHNNSMVGCYVFLLQAPIYIYLISQDGLGIHIL